MTSFSDRDEERCNCKENENSNGQFEKGNDKEGNYKGII
jgi:hypothetical protein